MSVKQLFIVTLIIFFFSPLLFAQKGFIRGTILEEETGLSSIGASVIIKGTTTGSITDFDGKYSISVDPGVYTIVVSYISYASQEISGVEVKSGEATIVNAKLKSAAIVGETFVVTAKQAKSSEGAIATFKKKTANLADGVSKETFKKVSASNAGDAIKVVTGVTVKSGKEVYVRGLGDRYTKTILNSANIPGLDPDKNSVQLDLFPTNIIDNIIVYKSFSPDLPGDFTGGMVNIATKDFPENKVVSFSASLSYNPAMNFRNNFYTYNGASSDGIALGASSRDLPFSSSTEIPRLFVGEDDLLETLTKSFSKNMSVIEGNSLINQNFSAGFGNQLVKENNTYGYTFALGYRSNYKFYEEVFFDRYEKNDDPSVFKLDLTESDEGSMGTHAVIWNGLLSGSIKRDKSKYSLTFFHVQNGIKTGTELVQTSTEFSGTPGAVLDKSILYYNQRSISNVLLNSKHSLNKDLVVTTAISPSLALNKEPDLRQTFFLIEDDTVYTLNNGDGARINRTYRNLNEININGKADLKWTFTQWGGLKSTFKTGFNYLYKKRDFDVVQYLFRDIISGTYSGEPDDLFTEENLFDAETSFANQKGIYVVGQIDPSNIYTSDISVIAGYLMNELPLDSALKVTYGVRVEKAVMRYTGERQAASRPEDFFNQREVLDELDILPAVNVVYSINENLKLKGSFSKTLARPSFKEKSGAEIYDAVTQRTFIGNLDLVETKIDNFDLRLERFIGTKDIVSVSAFYKNFSNPIELVAFSPETPDNITPRNVENAKVLGVEFEARKNLGFISEKLNPLSLGGNATFTTSEVVMSESEFQGRLLTERTGENIDNKRPFQGQAPFSLNAFISYSDYEKGLDINLSYNVQGKNLTVVGIARIPDVYSSPFHNLTFKASKYLDPDPEKRRHQISFTVRNLLGDTRDQVYSSFNTDDVLFFSFRENRTFNISYAFSLSK